MEAKDKAYELVNIFWKMTDYTGSSFGKAKLCAHVVVDELIKDFSRFHPRWLYLMDTKEEIDKLYD